MNKLTNLPTDVDGFLMDIAQMFESDDYELDYSDIISFSKIASKQDIKNIRNTMAEIADLDFDFEDDDAKLSLEKLITTVKGENVENSYN